MGSSEHAQYGGPAPTISGGPTPARPRETFRNYEAPARDTVREFYRINHAQQTWDFGQRKRAEYLPLRRPTMTLPEALDFLETLVDDSDPDLDLGQMQHNLQTGEAIRRDGGDDWFVLTGFIHDLGKVLCLFGEPQWAVVGDTFPVGCAFSERIVYPEFFAANPDAQDPRFATQLGVYASHCGLRQVQMSWGHDEYLYQMLQAHLPEEALYMIRFHSFYAWHREGQYDWLCDDHDRAMLPWVQRFNAYDLYSKAPTRLQWDDLKDHYLGLAAKYLPERLAF